MCTQSSIFNFLVNITSLLFIMLYCIYFYCFVESLKALDIKFWIFSYFWEIQRKQNIKVILIFYELSENSNWGPMQIINIKAKQNGNNLG